MILIKFKGWNRIYLFYGLIFFLLGFTGYLFDNPAFVRRLSGAGNNLLLALRSGDWALGSNRELAVLAEPDRTPVRILYPKCLRNHGLESELRQCQKALAGRLAQVKLEMITADFDSNFRRRAAEGRGITMGVNLIALSPGAAGFQIELRLSAPLIKPLPLIEQTIAVLADRSPLTFRLQQGDRDWFSLFWYATARDDCLLRTVILSLLERMQRPGLTGNYL